MIKTFIYANYGYELDQNIHWNLKVAPKTYFLAN